MALARKSIKQSFHPSVQLLSAMECFRQMTNDCIRIGLQFEKENGRTPSMRKLSLLCYAELRRRYGGYSQYALCAVSKAAGILSARKKSIRRGFPTKAPYVSRRVLVSSYGFKVDGSILIVHLDGRTFERIPLSAHTISLLSDPALRVRSFTLTEETVSLCVSKEVEETQVGEVAGALGIDRSLRNLAAGDDRQLVTLYDMSEVVRIGENTVDVVRSFTRNDARIRRRIASKYGKRRSDRTRQLLNLVSKRVVGEAKTRSLVIVFEEITGIRKLYRKGSGQSRAFRARMNSWPFHEIKRQIQYKAAWEGVPVITLTRGETRGTTMDCPRCGERLQAPVRGDGLHYRQLWCEKCCRWMDRDVVAVLNISRKGRLRFDRSQRKEGGAEEAMRGNAELEREPLILRVDASKLRYGQ
jgi:putative transposase